jgi:hypothetical protein
MAGFEYVDPRALFEFPQPGPMLNSQGIPVGLPRTGEAGISPDPIEIDESQVSSDPIASQGSPIHPIFGEKPIPEDVSTLGAFAETLGSVPRNLVAQSIGAWQGVEGPSIAEPDAGDRYFNETMEKNKAMAEKYKGGGASFIPGISMEEVSQLGPNLAFMGVNIIGTVLSTLPARLTGAAGGAAVGGAMGGPVGAIIGGTMGATGATVANVFVAPAVLSQRMQSYQQLQDWIVRKDEEAYKKFGKHLTKAEEDDVKKTLEEFATRSGYHEAGWESATTAPELALLFAGKKSAVGKIINSFVPRGPLGWAVRVGATWGLEMLGESGTQIGQTNEEIKAGMSKEKIREFTSFGDWWKSAKEVMPAVSLLIGFGGAVAGGVHLIRGKQEEDVWAGPVYDVPPGTLEEIKKSGNLTPEKLNQAYQQVFRSAETNPLVAYYEFMKAPVDANAEAATVAFKNRLDGMVDMGVIATPEAAAEILSDAIGERQSLVKKVQPGTDINTGAPIVPPQPNVVPGAQGALPIDQAAQYNATQGVQDTADLMTPHDVGGITNEPIPRDETGTRIGDIRSPIQRAASQVAAKTEHTKILQHAENHYLPAVNLDTKPVAELQGDIVWAEGLNIQAQALGMKPSREIVSWIKAAKTAVTKRTGIEEKAAKTAVTEATRQADREKKAAAVAAKQKLKADEKAAKAAAKVTTTKPTAPATPAATKPAPTTAAKVAPAATPAPVAAKPPVPAAPAVVTPAASRIYRSGFESEGSLPGSKDNTLRTVVHGVLPDGSQAQLNVISDLKGAVRSINITTVNKATGRVDTVNKHLEQKVKGQYTLADKGVSKITEKLKGVFEVKAWPEEWKQFAKPAAAPKVKVTAAGEVKKPTLKSLQNQLKAKTESLKTAEAEGYAAWQKANPGKVMSVKTKENIYQNRVTAVQERIKVIEAQIAEYAAEKEAVVPEAKVEAAKETAPVVAAEVTKKPKISLQEQLTNWETRLATAQAILADPEAAAIAKHGKEEWNKRSATKKANSIQGFIDTYTAAVTTATNHIAKLKTGISSVTGTMAAAKDKSPVKTKVKKVKPVVEVVTEPTVVTEPVVVAPAAITALAKKIASGRSAITPEEMDIQIKHPEELKAELVKLQEEEITKDLAALSKPPDVPGAVKAAAEATADVISTIWNETISGVKRGGISSNMGAIFDDVMFEKLKPVLSKMWKSYVELGQSIADWISYAVSRLMSGGFEHGAATAYVERWTAENNAESQASDKLFTLANSLQDKTTGRIVKEKIFDTETQAISPVTVAQAVQAGVPNASQYSSAQLTRINNILNYMSNPFRLQVVRGKDTMGRFLTFADMVKQTRSGLEAIGNDRVWVYAVQGRDESYITSEQWKKGMALAKKSLALENKVTPVWNKEKKKWEHTQGFTLLGKQAVSKTEAQIEQESGAPVTASNELMDWILSRAIADAAPVTSGVSLESTVKQPKASIAPENIISKGYKTDAQISDHILAAQKIGVDVTHIMSYIFDSGNIGDNLRSLRPASWEELKAARLKAAGGNIALAWKNYDRAQMTRFYEPGGSSVPLASLVIGKGGMPKLISTDVNGNQVIHEVPLGLLTDNKGRYIINENAIASGVEEAFQKLTGSIVTEDTRIEVVRLIPGTEPVASGNYQDYLSERIAKLGILYGEAQATGKDQVVEIAPSFGLNAEGKPNMRPRRANFASSEKYETAMSMWHNENMLQAYLTSHGDKEVLHKVTLSSEEILAEIGMLMSKQLMTSAVIVPELKILAKAVEQVEYFQKNAGEARNALTSAAIADISRELQRSQDEMARRTLITSQSRSSSIAPQSSVSTLNAKYNKLFVRASETYIDPDAAREFVVGVDKEDSILDPASSQYQLIDAQVKKELGRSLKSIVDLFKSEGIDVPIGSKYTLYYKTLLRDEDPSLVLQEGNLDRITLGKIADEEAYTTLMRTIRKNKDMVEAFKIFIAGKRDADGANLLGTKKGSLKLFVYLDHKMKLNYIMKARSSFELEKIAAGIDFFSQSSASERTYVMSQMKEVGAELDMIDAWLESREHVRKKASFKYLREMYSGQGKEKNELRTRLKEFLDGGWKKYNMEAVRIANEEDAGIDLIAQHQKELLGSFNNTVKYMDEGMLARVKQLILDSNYEMVNLTLTTGLMRTMLAGMYQIATKEITETGTAATIPNMGPKNNIEPWLAMTAVSWDERVAPAAKEKGSKVDGDVAAKLIEEEAARKAFVEAVSTTSENFITPFNEDDESADKEAKSMETHTVKGGLWQHEENLRLQRINVGKFGAMTAQAEREMKASIARNAKNKITKGEKRVTTEEVDFDNSGDSVNEDDPFFNMSAMDSKAEAVYSAYSPTSATGLWHGLIEMFGNAWRHAKDLANRLWMRLMARKRLANGQMVSTSEWNSLRMPGAVESELVKLPGIRDPRFFSNEQAAVIAAGRKLWSEISSNLVPLKNSLQAKEAIINSRIAYLLGKVEQRKQDGMPETDVYDAETAKLFKDRQDIQNMLYKLSGLYMLDKRYHERMGTEEGHVVVRATNRLDSMGTKAKLGQKWGGIIADTLGPNNPFFKGLNDAHRKAIIATLWYSNISMTSGWENTLSTIITKYQAVQELTGKQKYARQKAFVKVRDAIWSTAAPWHLKSDMLTIKAQILADAELARNIDSAVNTSVPLTKNWNMRLAKYAKNAEGKVTDKMVVFERHLTPAARAHINSPGYKFDLFDVLKNPLNYPDHAVKYQVLIDKGERARYLVTLPNGRVIHLQSMKNPETGQLAYHILEDQGTIRNADTVKFYEEIRAAEEVVEQTEQARIKAAKVSLMKTIQSTQPELTGSGINLSMLQDNIPNAVVTQLSRDSYQISFPSYSLKVDGNLNLEAVLRPKKNGRPGEMEWVAVNGTAFGRWTAGKGLLQLAKLNELDVKSALHHELFHMVAEIFMTTEEQQMFLKQFRKANEKTDVAAWERAAEAYLAWNQSTPNTTWERFMGWARRILSDLKSIYFKGVDPAMSVDSFFRDLRGGKIYSRTPQFNTLNPGVYKSGSLAHAYNMSTMPAQTAMEWARFGKLQGWLTDRAYSAIASASGRNANEIHGDRNIFEKTLDWTREGGLEKETGAAHQPGRMENALSNLLYMADNYPKSWGRVLRVVLDFTHKFETFRFNYITRDTKITHDLKFNERLIMDPLIIATNVIKRPDKDYFTEAQLRDPIFIKSIFTHPMVKSKITNYVLPDNVIKAYMELVETMKGMWGKMYDHAVFASLKPYQYSLLPGEFAVLKNAYEHLIKKNGKKPLSKEKLDEMFSEHIHKVVARKEIDPVTGKEKITKVVKSNPLKNAYKHLANTYNELTKYRQDIGHIPAYFPITHGVGSHYVAVMQNLPDGKGKGGIIRQAIHSYSAQSLAHAYDIKKILLKDKELAAEGIVESDIRILPTVKPEDAQYFLASEMNMLRLVELAKYEIQKDPDNRMSPKQAELFSNNIVKAIIDMKHTRTGGGTVLQRKLIQYEHHDIIKGYLKEDQVKIVDGYVLGWHGMMNKLDKSMEFLNIMKDVKIKQPVLYNDIAEYVQHDLRNTDKWDTMAGNIKTTAALWMLGGKLAAIPMQLSQNLAMTIPQMAVELGKLGSKEPFYAADRYVFGAMKDLAFDADLKNTKNFAPDEIVFMNYMNIRGNFMAQQLADIERNASALHVKWLKTVFYYAMWPMRAFESYNRKVAALSFYRMMKKNGNITAEQMYEKAESFVLHTQVFYGPQNYPLIARGGTMTAKVAGVAWTFKPFPHSYILNAIQNFRTGGAEDTYSNKAGMIYLGRSLAYIVAIGGIAALPFFDDFLEWLEKKYAIPFRANARAQVRKMLGSHGERFYQAGLAGLLTGSDISGAIRPIERPDTVSDLVLGVYGGLYEKATKAAQAGAAGEYIRAMENIAPTSIESIFKGIRLGPGAGMTTVAGQPVMGEDRKPFHLTPLESGLQVLGVKSYRYGTVQTERRSLQVILEGAAERAKPIREQMNRAGTPAERIASEKLRREFNTAIPLNMKGIIPEIQPWKPAKMDKKQGLFFDRFGNAISPAIPI